MLKIEKQEKVNKNIDAIYLHIPFCDKKCEYCDFCTFIKMEKEYQKYTNMLIEEIKMHSKYTYNTIYFGGGTPSLLSVEMLQSIMNELKWTKDCEITLELNPYDMSLEKLKNLKNIGINRLSIGIQSFQNHILKFIGRQHSGEEAIQTFKNARIAGFDNITIDLMFGIPNQTIEDLKKDLEIIKKLEPNNVSIYSLIWEEGTVFWSKLQKGILSEIDQDLEAQMYELIIDFFEKNGYLHYEISNFCRIDENFEKNKNAGKHNLKYWRNSEFIGVGMSAAGYYNGKRHSNVRILKKYYDFIENNKFPVDEKTIEIVDEKEKEKLKNMLGLRLVDEGIDYFEDEKVLNLLNKGLIEKVKYENKEKIRLTKKGILLANDVFVEFI